MVVKLKIHNVCAILLDEFKNLDKKSLVFAIDGEYSHEWAGDNWFGPGSVEVNVGICINKTYLIDTKDIYDKKSIFIFLYFFLCF